MVWLNVWSNEGAKKKGTGIWRWSSEDERRREFKLDRAYVHVWPSTLVNVWSMSWLEATRVCASDILDTVRRAAYDRIAQRRWESTRIWNSRAVICLSIVWPPTLVNFWFMFWWKATRVESILDIREELMHASTDPVPSTRLDENLNSFRFYVWVVWPPTLVNFWFMFWWEATRVYISNENSSCINNPVMTRLDENLNSCRLCVEVVWPPILTLNFKFQYIHCWFMFWREATTALLISDTRRARVFLDHSENLKLQLRKNINWESVIRSEYLYTNRNIKRSVYCQYG